MCFVYHASYWFLLIRNTSSSALCLIILLFHATLQTQYMLDQLADLQNKVHKSGGIIRVTHFLLLRMLTEKCFEYRNICCWKLTEV
jgi:hypothetical protein